MKHRSVYAEGEYSVWSGVEHPHRKGVFVVYWRGQEIGRENYLIDAQRKIDKHKNQHNLTEKIEDDSVWMREFEQSLAAGKPVKWSVP
jgi:hypothetical protein